LLVDRASGELRAVDSALADAIACKGRLVLIEAARGHRQTALLRETAWSVSCSSPPFWKRTPPFASDPPADAPDVAEGVGHRRPERLANQRSANCRRTGVGRA
jgi:hypothetical protein